jgi:hypothetical protein
MYTPKKNKTTYNLRWGERVIIRTLLRWIIPPGGDMQYMVIFGKGK